MQQKSISRKEKLTVDSKIDNKKKKKCLLSSKSAY